MLNYLILIENTTVVNCIVVNDSKLNKTHSKYFTLFSAGIDLNLKIGCQIVTSKIDPRAGKVNIFFKIWHVM